MDHEKTEDLVETPETSKKAARNLEGAANSDNTLEGYAAVNNSDNREEIDQLAREYAQHQGKDKGPDDDDRFRAEAEVRRRRLGVDGL